MATSSKKLNGYVTFTNPDVGSSQTFGPDDELPDWAAKQVTDAHTAEPTDDATDLPVAGPGQVAGEGMTEDEKAEARKAADRERKAAQRKAAKDRADAEAAALKAAEAAEAQRAQEQAAADKAAADKAAAGQGGS